MRLLAFLFVSTLAHGLAGRWLVAVSPAARRRSRLVMIVVLVVAGLLACVRLAAYFVESTATRWVVAVVMVEVAAVVLSLLPLGIATLAVRLGARAVALARPPEDDEARDRLVGRREAVERVVGASIFGATSVALGWGCARGRHAFAVEEVVVEVEGWPRALDGYVIAQVSDIHVGAFVGDRELDEGFELVRSVRPDLVVATGDLVDYLAEEADKLAARLLAVPARDGAYAILGNHDHYAGAEDVFERLRAAKVNVLVNDGVRLRAGDGGGFALLGVDDLQGRRLGSLGFAGPDLSRALRAVPPDLPRVLLAHQPTFFREASGRVALQLSGHTHGGQINPGYRPADAFMEFVSGRYERAGSTLWVNRGFGVVGPPARIGAPPEVTKIVIVGA